MQSLLRCNENDLIVEAAGKCIGALGAYSPSMLFLKEGNVCNGDDEKADSLEIECTFEFLLLQILDRFLTKALLQSPNRNLLINVREFLDVLAINLNRIKVENVKRKRTKQTEKWSALSKLSRDALKTHKSNLLPKISTRKSKIASGDNENFLSQNDSFESHNQNENFIKFEEEKTIFQKSPNYEIWICSFCLQILDFLQNFLPKNIQKINWILALKNLLRNSTLPHKNLSNIASFALPKIFFDLIKESDDDFVIFKIKREIFSVLNLLSRDSADSKSCKTRRCVSALFDLFRKLENWTEVNSTKRDFASDKIKTALSRIFDSGFSLLPHAAILCKAYPEALRLIERSRRLESDPKPQIWDLLHKCYGKQGEIEMVSAVERSGKFLSLHKTARGYELRGQWLDAINRYEQLLQENGNCGKSRKGLLRCLVKMGHFRSVLKQIKGENAKMSEAKNFDWGVYKYGVQAAWRLQQWEELKELVTRTKGAQINNFEYSVGKILSAATARSDIVASLLRNSRLEEMRQAQNLFSQSYQRAYAHVSRMAMLHELEQICAFEDENRVFEHKVEIMDKDFVFKEPLLSLRRVFYGL
ncbi:hypothetical protein MHBO_002584, partial [Bonamia ostreae]